MASEAQRRARRQARRAEGGGAIAAQPPAPPRRPTAREEAHGEPQGRRRRFNFIRESIEELQKVEWPTQNQVLQGTIVVLIACIIVGIYLWLADEAFRRLVQQVFLSE